MDQNDPPFQQQHSQPANHNEIRTLWIGDLHDWMDEVFLLEFLIGNSQNQVSNVSVIKNAPKRYGFIEFTSRDAAVAALQSLNDTQKPCWWVTDKFRLDWAESFNAGEGRNNPEYIPTRTPTRPSPTPTRADSVKKSYTIHMKSPKHFPECFFDFRPVISEEDQLLATEEHYRILATFLGSSDLAHEAMIQPFGKYFNGFSAFIHDYVAKEIEAHPNVESVFPTAICRPDRMTHGPKDVIPQVPRAPFAECFGENSANGFSAFGNSDGTCSPAMTYGPQVARAPFAECFGNNSTNGWSKSFSNKGYDSEGKAMSDGN